MDDRNAQPFDYDGAIQRIKQNVMEGLSALRPPPFPPLNCSHATHTRAQAKKLAREVESRVLAALRSLPREPYACFAKPYRTRAFEKAGCGKSEFGVHVQIHIRIPGAEPQYTPPPESFS